MPFTMKIQPIDSPVPEEATRLEPVKPAVRSRLKRLFERQFSGVLRNSSAAEKIAYPAEEPPHSAKDGSADFEPSSVCLAKMVQNFMEENHEKHSVSVKCARSRYNSFDDASDAETHSLFGESNYSFSGETQEILKDLVTCASVSERNLLADTTKIIEKNKTTCKRKDDCCRKIVTEALLALGYDASVCKSRWEKSTFCPAGEYEYIDVIMGKERVVVDVDFRSEFEIARPTKTYKAILQTLPYVFVGTCERLQSIVAIASEAAKLSLKKRGMHVPPWRKVEYVTAKWLSPYTCSRGVKEETEEKEHLAKELVVLSTSCGSFREDDEKSKSKLVVQNQKPPEMKPKSSQSGLAAVFLENPKF
ncbi:hypothetical protein AAZX31_19G146600 [Glycine max]|uniref:DUF506 family protein n=2 Tax=Glycine subgen. Soja TaxID=1462606 RepID=K7MYN0_SOYBN|nr:uncharacterized protein LOC100796711 [Glycine max]XP_006604476.1 uncharacterized protein LOC100796711 [Glycine max]XP_028216467.1 uncharacterized protein LOC114398467 [Glycine soja]XP_028216468.1 uncharacterized protein LOC114398467 [Glycine soja]KAG4913194.1 hypothetical protein JHK86_053627 [Glycine max]KAG5083614.1 hypothetical protein JHK84_053652 [Glycine max]KAG5086382.1 hypothetical protein JHK82_053779 [Glycine max]KAH1078067.1 hypothetical protein GYH30_053223 [Glycine max]KAH11|eukprot:XP_003554275.1 uncharacterized protein LOC100796711 [Glycine max]